MTVLDEAKAMGAELIELRHQLHQEPEVGLELPKTQKKVLDSLAGLPLEVHLGKGLSSVTAVLRSGQPTGNSMLLRADMDALPLNEQTDLPWRSKHEGVMHACGHDLHTSMLVGAAHLLSAHRHQLKTDVVLMFQPGEEGWHGADIMIEEGVLDIAGSRVEAAFGVHVFSGGHHTGQFLTREGAMMAAADSIDVTVHGVGGHGSTPHRAKDPVTAIAEMVTALQTMVTRQFDIFDPVVLSVGSLHAGSARNIIPDSARFEATLRTYSESTRTKALASLTSLVNGVAAAHGVQAEIKHVQGYSVTFNATRPTDYASKIIDETFHGRRTALLNPFNASEDFSLVLEQVPGSFIGIGATPAGIDPENAPFNHSPFAQYDDSVIPDGAALYAELALNFHPSSTSMSSDERQTINA